MPILSEIHVYPVKSLAGIQVERWPVDDKGLRYDRKWMLIDKDRQFLSQRRLPKMALIKTRIEGEWLVLSAPGCADMRLPLNSQDGKELAVEIWDDQCLARKVDDQIDLWLSDFLQYDCRLVYHPDEAMRQVDQNYAFANDQTAFSDGFPFLIVSQSSLDSLNQNLPQALEMQRFRPNLVISGCEAYAEDYWRRIAIDNIEFRLPKPCSRCQVPNIDPASAIVGKQPLAILNELRKANHKVYFGQNALHNHPGQLTVGASVILLETGLAQPQLSS